MGRFKHLFNHWSLTAKQRNTKRQVHEQPKTNAQLSERLEDNIQMLREIYADSSDIIFHEFWIASQTQAMCIYIDGLTNAEELEQHVLAPLQRDIPCEHTLSNIRKTISISYIKQVGTIDDVIIELSGGNAVLLVDHEHHGLSLGVSKWEKRGIQEPSAESVLRGPREGFIESLRVNTSLLRRKVRNPKLKIQTMNIGTYTVTPIAIAYVDGIAAPSLVKEVKSRLKRIEIDGILDSTYIEEMIEDNPYSLFPQLLSTERPDVASAYLLEGYVIVLIDGSPSALIAPTTMFSLLQSPEDYYERYVVGTAIRWLRYVFFAISLLAPSIYISVITFHQEMIPTTLLLTMAKSREQIPFPALIEALLMESMFEALREAGARLPKQVGTAVSIVGALVIGQAAISAGIVSAPMVMVVAITGVASFMVPRFIAGISVRLLRFPMMFVAGALGFLGLMLAVILLLNHLLALRSFGVPYLSTVAPMEGNEMKDVLWRAPRWKMITRPHLTGKRNVYRESSGQRPKPPNGDDGD